MSKVVRNLNWETSGFLVSLWQAEDLPLIQQVIEFSQGEYALKRLLKPNRKYVEPVESLNEVRTVPKDKVLVELSRREDIADFSAFEERYQGFYMRREAENRIHGLSISPERVEHITNDLLVYKSLRSKEY